MATLAENKSVWDGGYDWSRGGAEWSDPWGGPAMQWYGSILPRIHRPLRGSVLEIACGYGRWTHFLNLAAQRLTVVDMSTECIVACQKRFADSAIVFHQNDGRSLEMIPDHSMDFVFSYDSLVHAELDVIDAYLRQLPRILSDSGVAFIHHSNLGEFHAEREALSQTPTDEQSNIQNGSLDANVHWRDPSVDHRTVAAIVGDCGLFCQSQELVPWGTRVEIDCFTTISRQSLPGQKNQVFRNAAYRAEISQWKRLAQMYA